MQELKLDEFEHTFENDTLGSYLLIKTDSGKKTEAYQIEMIKNNKISYALPMDVRQKDDKLIFFYNITSRQTLSQLLKRKRLERNEFIDILAGVTKSLLDCRNYFLQDRYFIINEEYIYVNPATLDISMVYLPVKRDGDASKSLKNFITDIILNKADIDENSNDNFLQRIISHVRMENFNLYDFDKLLLELRSKQGAHINRDEQSEGIADAVGEDRLSESEKGTDLVEKKRVSLDIFPGKRRDNPAAAEKAPPRKQRYKTSVILIAAASQLLILLLVVFNFKLLKKINKDVTTTFLALGLIIGAVDFLLFRKLFDKKNLASTVEKPAESIARKFGRNKEVINTYRSEPLIEIKPVKKPVTEEIPVKPPAETGSETLFMVNSKASPCLKSIKDGSPEQIQISRSGLLIGRLREQVDCIIQNNAVGKIHAEVIIRDGSFYIKDLNSKNGTYINDEKIDSNKEYQIRNEDKVTFANSEYVFLAP